MGILFNVLAFLGRMTWSAGTFLVKGVGKAFTYVPISPRGKFIYGGATAGSVYFFNDDQYKMLEHVFIHSGSTHDFGRVIREYLTTDIGFASSAHNYLTNDYGKTMMIHVGLTAVTVMPLGLMAISGIRNPKAVASSVGLMAQWGTKLKNFKFAEFSGLFSKSTTASSKMSSLAGRVPVSLRQKFMKDFYAYFKKVNMKGKPAKSNGSDSVHARLSVLTGKPSKISQIKDIALRKDALALESIMTIFLAYWLAQNDDSARDLQQSIAESDMKRIDIFINDNYNFYFANSILGGDIHKIKTAMRIDVTTAKHVFISYSRIAVKIIGTWLNLNEIDRLRFHRLFHLHLNGIHDILQGNVNSTSINLSLLNSTIDAIAKGDLSKLVSTLALQRITDATSKKALYSGSDKSVTFRYLFHFIADNDEIKSLYADGAAVQIEAPKSTMKVTKKPPVNGKKTGPASGNTTTQPKKEKTDAPTKKQASVDKVAEAYDHNVTGDMLASMQHMVESANHA